jgi:RND superfamily putative drug exporter
LLRHYFMFVNSCGNFTTMNSLPALSPPPPTGLGRLAAWCFDHRRRVVAIWVAVLVAVIAVSQVVGGDLTNSFSSPSSPSGQAQTFLAKSFPSQAGDRAQVVVHTRGPVTTPQNRRRIDRLAAAMRSLPHVSGVVAPLDGRDQISPDRRIAYATVQFDQRSDHLPTAAIDRVINTAQRSAVPGFAVALDGTPISAAQNLSPGSSEAIGIVAAIVIMLLAFGSVIAMGLPIITALLGVGIGFGLVDLLSRLITVPTFGPELMAMIGLGVGIDYALFVVTRHRDGLRLGRSPRDATVTALQTSGRAVTFAGTTVIISLLGLFLIDQAFMDGMALASIFAVLTVLLATLTLLPAAFGFCGCAIDRIAIPRRRRTTTADDPAAPAGFWYRWSRQVQRRPWPFAIAAVVLVGLLTIPFLSMRLAFADAGNDPTGQTTRQAFDLLARGFGPGTNGPLVVAVKLTGERSVPVADALAQRVAHTSGVASASPARVNPRATAAVITATPTTAPSAAKTVALVHRLRDQVIPAVIRGHHVQVLVGGETAASVDSATHLSSRLPLVIGLVILLSVGLLAAVFRSIAIPIKAAVMNILSIGAAYGVIVAVFQWGWGLSAFGSFGTGPIDPWIPLMMFVITFGLSMDYEMFLLSAMQEEWVKAHDNSTAVANGLANTAKIITAAAAIMVCVFASFVINDPLRILDIFGLGLAVAILVDATVIRMILVPSIMEILGNRAWWMPAWLQRRLLRLVIDADPADPGAQPTLAHDITV